LQLRAGRPVAAPSLSLLPGLLAFALLAPRGAQAAVNSYRFLHVTIDTPWHIFLFLMLGIFAPFVLMVVLMWRGSGRRRPPRSGPPTGP
jgi:hypothetical protein